MSENGEWGVVQNLPEVEQEKNWPPIEWTGNKTHPAFLTVSLPFHATHRVGSGNCSLCGVWWSATQACPSICSRCYCTVCEITAMRIDCSQLRR